MEDRSQGTNPPGLHRAPAPRQVAARSLDSSANSSTPTIVGAIAALCPLDIRLLFLCEARFLLTLPFGPRYARHGFG